MRVQTILLHATALAFATSSRDVAASMASDAMKLSKMPQNKVDEQGPAESRLLRKHTPAVEQEDTDDEERGLEWLTKLLKLDDVPPQKAIEMTNLRKIDDIDVKKLDDVLDAKKLDDVLDAKKLDDAVDLKRLIAKKADDENFLQDMNYLVNKIIPDLKGTSPDVIRKDILEAGVKNEAAIAFIQNLVRTA